MTFSADQVNDVEFEIDLSSDINGRVHLAVLMADVPGKTAVVTSVDMIGLVWNQSSSVGDVLPVRDLLCPSNLPTPAHVSLVPNWPPVNIREFSLNFFVFKPGVREFL